ncbi:MAG: BapA prefix-like domain-containing protein, partial [Acinetobacter sp.]|uniref:GA-like domain-containing protein n=1 Tax=Acinetobacter sp. TaxID=472 RepID=UPI0026DEE621
MSKFVVIDKVSLDQNVVEQNHIILDKASILHAKLEKEDVVEMMQDGNNLVLKLKNGELIVIANFFAQYEGEASDLVLENSDGQLLLLDWNNGDPLFKEISDLETLAATTDSSILPALLPWAIGGAIIAAANGGDSKNSNNSKTAPLTPDEILNNALIAVTTAEAAYTAAEDALSAAQKDGLITPTEQAELEQALADAQTAKADVQDLVTALPSSVQPAKDGLQDRLDGLTDIEIPAVNDADGNGIVDDVDSALAAAETAVQVAVDAYAAAEDALSAAQKDGLITPTEQAELEQALADAQTAKADVQDLVTALPSSVQPAKDGLQDRLDGLTDIEIPAVNDADGNGIVDDVDSALAAAETAVQVAVDAYAAAEDALSAAQKDGLITPTEQAELEQALADAQTAKADVQDLVTALPSSVQPAKDGLQDRLDGLTDIEIPAVNDADGNGIVDDVDSALAAAETAVQVAVDAYAAAEDALSAAQKDGLITPTEQAELEQALADAQAEKAAAQKAVDSIRADFPTESAAFQTRLDAL